MIRYVKGNILESSAQALVNTVNTEGVMGKGLALQFKERYPENYRIYRSACKRGLFHVGEVLVTEHSDLTGSKLIINFPTKTTWRKPSSYQFIADGLVALKQELTARSITSVAIPPLGSRNGGLDWNRVKPMIEEALKEIDCDIIIYEPSDIVVDMMRAERVKLTPARAMMLDVVCDLVNQGEFLSEFSAEKIVYFLQRFGAQDEFKLVFKHGYYGPYSGKVRYVLRYLNGSYLMGLEEMNQRPFEPIWLSPETKNDVDDYLVRIDAHYSEIASKAKQFLDGFYSNYSLELLATVDFIILNDMRLCHWIEMPLESVIEIVLQDVSNWSNRKKQLFGEEKNIRLMLAHLMEWSDRMSS